MGSESFTVNDWITEIESFPYSKEYYNFTKECFELDLMIMYLESQEYLMENSDLMNDDIKSTLLIESMNADEVFFESIGSKLNTVWKAIGKISTRIFDAVVAVLKKITNKITDIRIKNTNKEINRLLLARKGSPSDIKKLEDYRNLCNTNGVSIEASAIFFNYNHLFPRSIKEIKTYLDKLCNVSTSGKNLVKLGAIVASNVAGAAAGIPPIATIAGVGIAMPAITLALALPSNITLGTKKKFIELKHDLKAAIDEKVERTFSFIELHDQLERFEEYKKDLNEIRDLMNRVDRGSIEIKQRGTFNRVKDSFPGVSGHALGASKSVKNIGDSSKSQSIFRDLMLLFITLRSACSAHILEINKRLIDFDEIDSVIDRMKRAA